MGFDRRFTVALLGWTAAMGMALTGLILAFSRPGLSAVRLVAAAAVLAAVVGLIRHVERTNTAVARFVEALRFGDFTTRFRAGGGAGFDRLADALDGAVQDLRAKRDRTAEELRFLDALVDDAPVALLTVDGMHGVRPANKVARRLFDRHDGSDPADFALYGEAFARRLGETGPTSREVLTLRLDGGTQRAVVRAAALERLGSPIRVVAIEPIQNALEVVEVAAQTDLVRVLTHEILNSLTPVTSLAGTAAALLNEAEPDIAEARLAVAILARRAEGLHRFIDSYRAVARSPEPSRRHFEAQPFAAELARVFASEWIDHRLEVVVEPGLQFDSDPDLLAQALINLLRNAAQASVPSTGAGRVALRMAATGDGVTVEVEDDGPGVPDPIRADIFLPFFTTRAAGTGVGLNLVRQIVIAHGWRIEVASGRWGGALFSIAMPPSQID